MRLSDDEKNRLSRSSARREAKTTAAHPFFFFFLPRWRLKRTAFSLFMVCKM